MKILSSSLVVALILALALPASADALDDLAEAALQGNQGKIDVAMDKILAEPVSTPAVCGKLKELIAQIKGAEAKRVTQIEEAVLQVGSLLILKGKLKEMMANILESLDQGTANTSGVIERAICMRSCHGLREADMKKEGLDPTKWKDRKRAWTAWWGTVKDKKHPVIIFMGLKRAGLNLPPEKIDASTLEASMTEFFKGLDHADYFVRGTCYELLSHMLEGAQFDYEVEAEKKVRDKAANEMKVHYNKHKAKAHKFCKEILQHAMEKK